MTSVQHDSLYPPNWNKAAKLRQEKIAKRLSENGGKKVKEVDMEAIRSRRARLEELTKAMRSPRKDKRSTSRLSPSVSSSSVKLKPLGSRSPNELDKKRREDSLLKRPKSSHKSSSSSSSSSLPSKGDSEAKDGRREQQDLLYENSTSESVNEKNVREILRQVKGRTEEERLMGVYRARKHLSIETDPPFDMYIEEGGVPLLVSCLSSYNPSLQFEAAWALTNISSGTSEHAMAVYEGGAIPELVILLSSPYNRVADQCVWAIGNLVGDSSFLWQTVIDEGAIKPLYNLIEKSTTLSALRNLSWTFNNILRHKPLTLSNSDFNYCVKAVRLFIHHPDKEIHLNACWSVVYITDNDNEKIEEVLTSGMLPRISGELLNSNEKKTVTPALRAVGNIMTGTNSQTDRVVDSDVLPHLVRHLDHSSSSIRKDCAWALSNIMAGTEDQIQKAINADALPALAVTINKDEPRVQKEAVWSISNLTQSGSEAQVDAAIAADLLQTLARNLGKKNTVEDKQHLHVALEGVKNMLERCSDKKEASGIILEEFPLKDIERMTYDEDKAIGAVAAKLQLLLAEHSADAE